MSRWLELKEKVSQFPTESGVYLMKSQDEKIIYVGKAKSLRARVRSYFQSPKELSPKTRYLMQSVWLIDYIVTKTEIEALLLEAQLIKKYRPKYNIRLKDDKSYPYIKIDWKHPYPRLYVSRKVVPDDGFYFGPYPQSAVAYSTMDFINETFQIRDCQDHDFRSRHRPCMTYEIKRCTAPCVGIVNQDQYREQVQRAQDFLLGKSHLALTELEQRMWELAKEERFEEAAHVRDRLQALKVAFSRKEYLEGTSSGDVDCVVQTGDEDSLLFEMFHVRRGNELGSRSFYFSDSLSKEDPRDFWVTFLVQYYEDNFIPDQVLLGIDLGKDLFDLTSKYLSDKAKKNVLVRFASGEYEAQLLEKTQKAAREHWEQVLEKSKQTQDALLAIQNKFHLPKLPWRIEAYDLSHFQGSQAVGSMVVFLGGKPDKESYRRFRIKEAKGGDDYGGYLEILRRRFQHEEWPEPDLIVIDGGRGQLAITVKILKELHRNHIPVVSLAKARVESNFRSETIRTSAERFFLPHRKNPVTFPVGHPAYQTLIQLRDEAHRFAVSYHRLIREQNSLASLLDEVHGIGPIKKNLILERFESLEEFLRADLQDLVKLLQVSEKKAKEIQELVRDLFSTES